MDALVVERVCAEWTRTLDGLAFRGVCLDPAGARIYLGPPRGSRGHIYSLVARWPDPLWLWLEESALPKERDRVAGTLRLDGSPLLRLTVPPGDRRVRLELGWPDRPVGFLEIEAWPPGNILLVDAENKIHWIARRRPTSSVRAALAPGLPYADPPTAFRRDSRGATVADVEELLKDADGIDESELTRRLAHNWSGVTGPLGEKLAVRLLEIHRAAGDNPAAGMAEFLSGWANSTYAADGPVLGLRWEDKHKSATLVSAGSRLLPSSGVEMLGPWPSWETAAKLLAAELPEAISTDELAEARGKLRRLDRALQAAERDLEQAKGAPELRRKGEAILASLHLLDQKQKRARVPDPADPDRTIEIQLDPKLKPHQNASRLFKLARKGDRAMEIVPARIRVLREDRDKALEVLDSLEKGIRLPGVEPPKVRGTLTPAKPARSTLGPTAQKGDEVAPRLLPHRYKTSEGWEIWIGKNNDSNDYLTHRLARGEDYWFHAQGSPGSHVVLRRGKGKNEPSRETIREVAAWTAFNSRQRTAGTVPVIYTLKKYVRKPRGAKPGLAEVQREKSVFVRPVEPPDEARISGEEEAV
jgi:predicted ribosome quality control (RQC) complex YloA/Tae2 family protein